MLAYLLRDHPGIREGVLHSRKPLRTVRFEQMGGDTDVAKLADSRPNPTTVPPVRGSRAHLK